MKRTLLFLLGIFLLTVSINAKMIAVGGSAGISNLSNSAFSSDRNNMKYAGFLMFRTPIFPLQVKGGIEYKTSTLSDTVLGIPYNSTLSDVSYFLSADFRYHIIMSPLTPYIGVGASVNNLKGTLKAIAGGTTVSSDTTYTPEVGVNGHIGLAIEPVKTFSIFLEGSYGQIFTKDLSDFDNKNISDFGGRAGIIFYLF